VNLTRRKWLWSALAILVVAISATLAYQWTRPRYDTAAKLVGLLPQTDAVVFYADVAALRHSGYLQLLESAQSAQEPDYQRFVSETGFVYQRDLDAVAVASQPNQIFVAARGHFDWRSLSKYAINHGGKCSDRYCQLPATKPDQWISFLPIQASVLGLAVSADPRAAYSLLPREGAPEFATPQFPIWAEIPHRVLDHPDSLPPGIQVLARALSSASQVILGITETAPGTADSALNLRLVASCPSDAVANDLRDHLAQLAGLFRGFAAHKQPQSGGPDLAGLLASGTFGAAGQDVVGNWTVPRSVLEALFE
jgi:hypothetical protein